MKKKGFDMWTPSEDQPIMSEDCLYLNIWVPAEAYLNINMNEFGIKTDDLNNVPRRVPIIVYFHGGGTVKGSSSLSVYDPSAFVAVTNVIVITINYRLGVFGSLYLDGEFQGNQGLLDQVEALRWIRRNAAYFGGDANRITIVGQDSGAVMAGLHLFHRESWSLFNNIIMQSGTPLMPALSPISAVEANRRARLLFELAGCANETKTSAGYCAQMSPNIIRASEDIWEKFGSDHPISKVLQRTIFPPVIDGYVLREMPEESLANGNFKRCAILTGSNADEGSFYIAESGIFGSNPNKVNNSSNYIKFKMFFFKFNFIIYLVGSSFRSRFFGKVS
jgi:carboxylesterase type B